MLDHSPILLDTVLECWGPPAFGFELFWLMEPGFSDLIKQWWNEADFYGWMGF